MKKLMGISVIAALAVMPMAANAARTVQTGNPAGAGSATALASQSYVNGAYNAMNTKVDAVITDSAVAARDTTQPGVENYVAIKAGDSVSENLVALDDKIANLTSAAAGDVAAEAAARAAADTAIETKLTTGGANGYAISANTLTTAGNATIGGNETVAGTLGVTGATTLTGAATLNGGATVASGTTVTASGATIAGTQGSEVTIQHAAIDADDNVITDLVTTNFKTGVVQTSVRAAESATDTALVTEKAVRDAIDTITDSASTLSGRVDTLEDQMGDTSLSNVTDLDATDVTSAVVELQNDKQEKSDSTVAAGTNYLTAGTGVGANLTALDTQVATINAKQIPIVSDWTNQNTVTYTAISALTSGNQ